MTPAPEADNPDNVSVCSCTCYGTPRRGGIFPDYPSSGSRWRRRKSLLRRDSSSLMMMTVAESSRRSTTHARGSNIVLPSNAAAVYARKGSTFSTASAAPAYYRHYVDDQDDGRVLAIEEEDLPSPSFDLDDINDPLDAHHHKQEEQEEEEADFQMEEEDEDVAHTFHYTNSSFNYSGVVSESNNNYRQRQPLSRPEDRNRQQVTRDSHAGTSRDKSVVPAFESEGRWHRYTPLAILRSMSSGRQSSSHELSRRTTGTNASRDRQLITSTDDDEDENRSRGAFHVMPRGRRRRRTDRTATQGPVEGGQRALITHRGDSTGEDRESQLKRASI